MNKKGFTLIELLAVILILGIIALIAIPTVNNIILESKVGAWKSTANNVLSSYEQYYQIAQMKGDEPVIYFSDGEVAKTAIGLKGDMPDGDFYLALNDRGDAYIQFFDSADNVSCSNFTYASGTVTIGEVTCEKGDEYFDSSVPEPTVEVEDEDEDLGE